MKFEYWRAKTDQLWYWHLIAGNGKVIADGAEAYESKRNVQEAIERLQEHLAEAVPVQLRMR